jgi:hypothetical protein
MTKPTFLALSRNSASVISPRQPGMDSSLSMVPPVWARPRPDILATVHPLAARMGATTRVVLSPTPPEECLSTGWGRWERSRTFPEWAMISVSQRVSSWESPRKKTAMSQAETW